LFRAKLATERLIEDSGLPWAILRATEFHDLMLMVPIKLSKAPVAVVAHGARFQPVDVRSASSRWVHRCGDRQATLLQRPYRRPTALRLSDLNPIARRQVRRAFGIP
jgi:hypothetical protein